MIYSIITARIPVAVKASFKLTRSWPVTSSCLSSCVQRKQLIEVDDSNANISLHNINNNKLPSTQNHRTDLYSNKMGSTAVNNATTSHQCTSEEAANAPPITDIEELHHQAIIDKQSTYIDPATGFTVFTELAHLKRGKCCGNQCRHCPYGWSNVRNENGEFSQNDTGRVVSGDREGAARLVSRILNGTYYEEEDECTMQNGGTTQQVSREEVNGTHDDTRSQQCNNTTDDIELNDSQKATVNSTSTTAAVGKGGSAGGTLTSKNVPYTRKGDTGTSQLFTGERRNKDDVLFEALGTVDELCSIVGVVYAELNTSKTTNNSIATTYGNLPEQLLDVMSRLFDVGSHIAKPVPQNNGQGEESSSTGNKSKSSGFHSHHTSLLEEWIDTMTDELPELTSFILPTGSTASAQLHVARTVCRRAERRMVPLVQDERTVDPDALAYVNRLSDFFFTAARYVNYCEDRDEVQYRSDSTRSRKGANFQRERVVVKLKSSK